MPLRNRHNQLLCHRKFLFPIWRVPLHVYKLFVITVNPSGTLSYILYSFSFMDKVIPHSPHFLSGLMVLIRTHAQITSNRVALAFRTRLYPLHHPFNKFSIFIWTSFPLHIRFRKEELCQLLSFCVKLGRPIFS